MLFITEKNVTINILAEKTNLTTANPFRLWNTSKSSTGI